MPNSKSKKQYNQKKIFWEGGKRIVHVNENVVYDKAMENLKGYVKLWKAMETELI